MYMCNISHVHAQCAQHHSGANVACLAEALPHLPNVKAHAQPDMNHTQLATGFAHAKHQDFSSIFASLLRSCTTDSDLTAVKNDENGPTSACMHLACVTSSSRHSGESLVPMLCQRPVPRLHAVGTQLAKGLAAANHIH